jgi:hypothetical protein
MDRARLAPAALLTALAGLAVPAAAQCPPNNPTGLQASDGEFCGSVFLNWNDVGGANTYTVYRNTVNNYSTSQFVGVAVASQFTDLTASIGETYYYWVTATHTICLPGSGTSGPSNGNSGYRAQEPAAPTLLTATNGCNNVRLGWSQAVPLGATVESYTIYRNTINLYLTSSAVGTITDGSLTHFVDYTAEPGTTYYYWVRAENGCGTAASDAETGSAYFGSGAVNNSCASGTDVTNGTYLGSTTCASADGASSCGTSAYTPDVWYRYLAPTAGTLHLETCTSGVTYDTVLSVHSSCPGTTANQIACNDDACGLQSALDVPVAAGNVYLIRVSGYAGNAGDFVLTVAGPEGCYANCDASSTAPVLNVLDFNCFLNRFAAGASYANCDGSAIAPVLNVLDFNCFLNRFAAGCP